MRLFIIRHADPDYANNTITPAGHLEAKALAKRLQRLGLDKIYCSPLGRALDTMRYTSQALDIAPVVVPWTAELAWANTDSAYGPGAAWDVHGHLLRQHKAEMTRSNWHEFSPLSHTDFREGVAHVQQNSDAFLAKLGYERDGEVYRIMQPNRDKIAIFCHAGFGMTWLAHLLHIPVPLIWTGVFLPLAVLPPFCSMRDAPSSPYHVAWEWATSPIYTPRG